jgi:hypothetical protein
MIGLSLVPDGIVFLMGDSSELPVLVIIEVILMRI